MKILYILLSFTFLFFVIFFLVSLLCIIDNKCRNIERNEKQREWEKVNQIEIQTSKHTIINWFTWENFNANKQNIRLCYYVCFTHFIRKRNQSRQWMETMLSTTVHRYHLMMLLVYIDTHRQRACKLWLDCVDIGNGRYSMNILYIWMHASIWTSCISLNS